VGGDNFRTADLEKRLVQSDILVKGKFVEEIQGLYDNDNDNDGTGSESESENDGIKSSRRGIRQGTSNRRTREDDSDDDWD